MICTQPPLEILKNHCCRWAVWGGGERAGRMRHWRLPGWMAMTIVIATNWEKKIGQGKRRGGIQTWVRFFMLSYFVIVFWLLFFNAGWLIPYQDQVNCWMGFSCKISLSVFQIWWLSYYSSSSSWLFIGYLLQDFSSNHPNLVIIFLFGNYSVRVNCCK